MSILKTKPDLRAQPMREIIFDRVREAIVRGELAADTSFTDAEIAGEFGVSRTPAREALQKLESGGYIERVPMKGNRVCGLSARELAHCFAIRKAVETLAVQYAATRIAAPELDALANTLDQIEEANATLDGDRLLERLFPLVKQFNEIIFGACGSTKLLEQVWAQREIFDRYRVMRLVLPEHLERSIIHRRELFEAFKARDPARARAVWAQNLDESFIIWRDKSGFARQLEDFRLF